MGSGAFTEGGSQGDVSKEKGKTGQSETGQRRGHTRDGQRTTVHVRTWQALGRGGASGEGDSLMSSARALQGRAAAMGVTIPGHMALRAAEILRDRPVNKPGAASGNGRGRK
ncbi:MAG TPA: hypothetical protein VND99_02400 [Candidatus Acidoferrales bacterium]|nr:hypothetical protein [Candidatus Acidoferrales bacterium]